jgi:hydroxymethylglutaryl-CoA lyase
MCFGHPWEGVVPLTLEAMRHGVTTIDTGVDLTRLYETSAWLANHMGRPSPSRTVRALTGG